MNHYKLYCDGSVDKNPGGEGAFGYVIYLDNNLVDKGCGIFGHGKFVNSVSAEYYSISQGLSSFLRIWNRPNSKLTVYSDSIFVVNQLQKTNKLRPNPPELRIIDFKIKYIQQCGIKVDIKWIPREQNKEADSLARHFRVQVCQKS